MQIVDITGPTYHGMWTYGSPYPEVVVEEIPAPEWIEFPTYSWRFELGAQTGTYLETSLHLWREGPPLVDIPVESLFMRDAVVVHVPKAADERIEVEDLEASGVEVRKGDAVFVDTGWDAHWDQEDFVAACPWFSHDAMCWILDREPFLMGGDMPRFDSWADPQGFFGRFFRQGTLLLAPVVNLGQVTAPRCKLVALPFKVTQSCAAPCRALLIEGG
jgi:kynurenine formamidase